MKNSVIKFFANIAIRQLADVNFAIYAFLLFPHSHLVWRKPGSDMLVKI